MKKDREITKWFGSNLAELLGNKILKTYKDFDKDQYVKIIERECTNLPYSKRIELHADTLRDLLPKQYSKAIGILTSILEEENPNETGMFTNYYWIMPIGKFVEKYGLEDFDISINAIEEITKRNTGEYAIRPFIRKYPEKSIRIMQEWAHSDNFHLRRLASEGCRPKLPWATKLDVFVDNPEPVFKILEILMEDDIKFVQRSVANNLADYLKVNRSAAKDFLENYKSSKNENTKWIIKHATRKD